MARTAIPFHIEDISTFARQLGKEIAFYGGHQALLSHIARAGGYKNWQHFKAVQGLQDPDPAPNEAQIKRALRCFDEQGRLAFWHSKTSIQLLCMWPLWAQMSAGMDYNERTISAALDGASTLGDAAQLRRTMVEAGLVRRTVDGTVYTRIEQRPSVEGRRLMSLVGARYGHS